MIKNVNKLLIENNIESLLISKKENQRYITNFTGSTSLTMIVQNQIHLFTDGRYTIQAQNEVPENVQVHIITQGKTFLDLAIEIAKENNVSNVGIEQVNMNVQDYTYLKERLGKIELSLTTNIIENLRKIKREDELVKIRQAIKITDQVYSILRETVKPGMKEIEIATLIDAKHKEFGAEKNSFDSIVASGKNASKPHGRASQKVIEDGDIITIDFGCFYQGYASDMTRTFFVGEPKNEELVKIYNIVKEAHLMQVKAVKPGVKCSDIDKIGRDYITQKGYGNKFVHGTGHSFGLEVHEDPRVNATSEEILKENMIITIEPGIYIEGLGGVRIENDILVTSNGYEVLNTSVIDEY